jgi:glyoxylase-like metal-dependent hydrolase (beta-lactamase superfamily II)
VAAARRRGFAIVDTGYGNAPTRALWERHLRGTLRGAPITRILVTHYHPTTSATARGCGALRRTVEMTLGEFLQAHAVHGDHAGSGVATTAAHFSRHGMARRDVDALRTRGNRYRQGRRSCRALPAHAGRRPRPIGERTFTVIRATAIRPSMRRCYSRCRRRC